MQLKDFTYLKVKKRGIIPGVLLILLLHLTPLYLPGQETGYKFFKNYSAEDYDHYPQNWAIAQAENGILYVANNAGILEYDGVTWRYIEVPNLTVRSLAIDKTGTVYIGGVGEIGFLAPDSTGTLKFKSLTGHLPEKHKEFSTIMKTYVSGKGVYFQASKFLARWDSKEMKVWEPMKRYLLSFVCQGKLFIRSQNVGLLEMVDDSLKLVPEGEKFASTSIFMMVPYDSNCLLIGTGTGRFFLYNGAAILSFPTKVEEYLKENELYHGIRLTSGDFAMATHRGGLVVMTPHGHLKHIFDKTSGLPDNNVNYVFEDNLRNLWLCLNEGISKIEYASPISIHDERSNLSGLVLSVARYHNDLYAGTTTGLYHLESPYKFVQVPGISVYCRDLLPAGDSLLAATNGGVFQVDTETGTKRKIIGDRSFVLFRSRHYSRRTWCGTHNGLTALIRENGRWENEYRFDTIDQPILSIVEGHNGNVWLGTQTGSVYRVGSPVDILNPSITHYNGSHGLPGGEIYVGAAAGHVLFATGKGIYRFDGKTGKFIPDGTLGADFAGGKRPVFRIVEDKNKNIWFHSESRNYLAEQTPEGSYLTNTIIPLRRIPTTFQVNALYPDPDGKIVWFATNEGLIRYDTTVEKNYRQNFQTIVRKIFVNEKLIFDGFNNKTGNAVNETFPIFDYKDRNLRFEFAAPFFEAETETRYHCFMDGYDENWSPMNKDTKMNYTNLDAGLYTFRVKAKNVYGQFGDEDVFRFKVLPPWYETWLAYIFYGIGFIFLIFFVVKWRSRRLVHEKEKLEQTVLERTKEINEKNQQLETQTVKLKDQSEKLKEMDEVKSRFFANISHEFRTPLTLIMGPIEQIYSHIRDKKQKDTLNIVLQNSQRLLTLINQLLDLSRLDSGKMKLQAVYQNIVPFLKGILAAFSTVALENKLNIAFQPCEKEIPLYFETQKMEEALCNLLINAVKFTPPGGKITVSVSREREVSPGFVSISVRDTGIGIPKDQFDHIFDRFFRAGNSKGKYQKGTGIGLALVKEIVSLHHGKIDVHSQEGKGTEFVIRLPMGDEHLKPDEIAASPGITAPGGKKEKEIAARCSIPTMENGGEKNKNGDQYIEPGSSKDDQNPEQEKNVILVVEDNPDMRKYIRGPLEPHYTVVEAGDGKEGIKKAREIIPDLIVSDIMMPGVDGYELCRVLKKNVNTSHIPIIFLTAKASEKSEVRGLETGADDYVTKPFSTKILLIRIKNLIDLRRQMQLKIQRQKMLLPDEISVSSVDDIFLKEFQDMIKANLSDMEFNIDTLCQKLYMGRSTLYRKVQALTGETPHQFILSYRLERAAQLLKSNYGNVTEVAMATGFSNPQHFSQCFKEKFHQSPSSFKASEG